MTLVRIFRVFALTFFAAAIGGAALAAEAYAGPPEVKVYKTATCGCCNLWVDHLRENGFSVSVQDLDDLAPVKHMAGVPQHLLSCHTAIVDGYAIEGHVPASAIERLLAERPLVAGLAVPGMPQGSPGMPSLTPERYDVIAFGSGGMSVFATFVGTAKQ